MDITKPKPLAVKMVLGDQILDFDSSNISPPPPKAAGKELLFSAIIPYNQAEIGAMDRSRKLEFLFNPVVFTDCMKRWEKNVISSDPLVSSRNVLITLSMLWSNTFPLANNIQVSSNLSTPNVLGNSSVLEQFNRIMGRIDKGGQPYAAVKQGGQIYTLQKCTWLNDVVNNPIYKPLLQAIYSYDIWTKFKLSDILLREIENAWKIFQKQKTDASVFLEQTDKVVNQSITPTQIDKNAALGASMTSIEQIRKTFQTFNNAFLNFSNSTPHTPTNELYPSLKTIYDNIELIQEPSIKSQFSNAFSSLKPLYSIFRIWQTTQNNSEIFIGTDDFLQRIPEYTTLRAEMDKFEKIVLKCDNDEFINIPIKEFFTPLGDTSRLRNLAGYVCHNLLKFGETTLKRYIAESKTPVSINYTNPTGDLTTGLIYQKDGKLTVYVCLDAIQEEITPENRGKYSCPVKGETLGQLSEVLFGMKYAGNPNEIVSHIIGPFSKKSDKKTAAAPLVGGRTKRRRRRALRRTRFRRQRRRSSLSRFMS